MKVLIWFLCLLVASIIQTIIGFAGYQLGAIPVMILYGITYAVARKLCEVWEYNHPRKKHRDEQQTYETDK